MDVRHKHFNRSTVAVFRCGKRKSRRSPSAPETNPSHLVEVAVSLLRTVAALRVMPSFIGTSRASGTGFVSSDAV
jgi:hypothetical protein